MLISHDRYFLDVTVSKIAEIWNKRVHFYTGGYSKYEEQKTERRAQLEAAYANQRTGSSSWKPSSTASALRRQKPNRCRAASRNSSRSSASNSAGREDHPFRFPQPKPSGRIVAEFKNVAKSYGDKHVFSGVDFIIERGDRMALVGVNGAGKSTLIKMLRATEPVTAGEYTLGHNVTARLFRAGSIQGARSPTPRMLDDLATVSPRAPPTPNCAASSAAFSFPKTMCSRRIGVLSGGERNRYALARMLMMPANFLLLDEPTNHLDMRAKDVLLDRAAGVHGTVVFVSHDRYFIDKLATRVFEVADGTLHVYPGNYEDYLWRKSGGAEQSPTIKDVLIGVPPAEPIAMPTLPPPAKRINPIKLKQMQEQAKELEGRIAELEAGIQSSELALSDFVGAGEAMRLSNLLEAQRAELARAMTQWEEVTEELEATA